MQVVYRSKPFHDWSPDPGAETEMAEIYENKRFLWLLSILAGGSAATGEGVMDRGLYEHRRNDGTSFFLFILSTLADGDFMEGLDGTEKAVVCRGEYDHARLTRTCRNGKVKA